jgi:hypothetical protein
VEIKEVARMNMDVRRYYTTQDVLTDPGTYRALLETLPTDLPELHAALSGVLIHEWKVRVSHPELLTAGQHDVFTRHIAPLLGKVAERDSRPLVVERPVQQRMIVDCRHFATVLCAALRQRGVPARPRSGFATYLEDTHYQDHWVCEFWDADAGRWIMEDADLQRHDVPADEFITGAQAWQLARTDAEMAERFGFDATIRGIDIARINLVRDFAALNGFASVSGDEWGLASRKAADLTDDDLALLDRAAALALADDDFDARRALYEGSTGLRVPPIIDHFDYLVTHTIHRSDWQREP